MSDLSLFDLYKSIFEPRLVRTEAEAEIAYRLRYQVYCIETGFLPIEDNPGGLERDRFDDHSVQSLLYHKPSGQYAGCIRIILPRADEPYAGQPARMNSSALMSLGGLLPAGRSCEISRFAISKEFRRRQDDTLYPASDPAMDRHRRILPHITLGLMHCVMRMSIENNMTHLMALVEPALYRLLFRVGLEFEKVGQPIPYHGVRQPIHSSLDRLLRTLEEHQPEVWEVITDRGALKHVM